MGNTVQKNAAIYITILVSRLGMLGTTQRRGIERLGLQAGIGKGGGGHPKKERGSQRGLKSTMTRLVERNVQAETGEGNVPNVSSGEKRFLNGTTILARFVKSGVSILNQTTLSLGASTRNLGMIYQMAERCACPVTKRHRTTRVRQRHKYEWHYKNLTEELLESALKQV